jgi:hypothetical protein
MAPPKYKTRADVVVPASLDAQQRRVVVRNFVHQQIPINLGAWKTEVNDAIGIAAPPARPESRFFWYLALAGNLVWAATCLIAPPAAAGIAAAELAAGEAAERFMTRKEIARQLATDLTKEAAKDADKVRSFVSKTMNFGGAAVGSGVLESKKKDPGPDDGKALVRDIIGKRRANLEDDYKKNMRDDWTKTLLEKWDEWDDVDEPLEGFDLFLWTQMFPSIPYDENRFNTIRNGAQRVIESALADYNRQWYKYQTDISMPQPSRAYALWAMGTLAEVAPFSPKLLFKID